MMGTTQVLSTKAIEAIHREVKHKLNSFTNPQKSQKIYKYQVINSFKVNNTLVTCQSRSSNSKKM